MEKRILKVLKMIAEHHEISLGDLLEGIVLHAFEGRCPFDDASLHMIAKMKEIFDLDLTAADSHLLSETDDMEL
ncbi:MAG: hypothetical protein KDC35_10755 [Acidobacteria bacterium]|nr:hypothetical protein [Acidobacteriota bacterium]